MNDDDDFDDYDDGFDRRCHTCGGDGFVESVAAETGRHFWDTEGPGECPNCRGSGLAKAGVASPIKAVIVGTGEGLGSEGIARMNDLPFISLRDFEREAWYWTHDATGVGLTARTERFGSKQSPAGTPRHRVREAAEPLKQTQKEIW